MRAIHAKLVSILVLLSAQACLAQADPSTNDILPFADHLYAQKDYYRAITEYKRFLFLNASNSMAATAEYQIGMSYLHGGKLETAAQVFSDLADKYFREEIGGQSLLMMAKSYSMMKKYREAQDTLEEYLARYPDDQAKDAIRIKIGWYLLCQGESNMALEKFRDCPENSTFRAQSERMTSAAKAYDELPQKSPVLAGSLSAALPGAGQIYAGRPRDGLVAFLVNGVLIWAAAEAFDKDQNFAGSMFALLDVSWYAGNIYNAINSANKINRTRKQNFLNDVEVECGLTLASRGEDGLAPTLALRISF